MPLERREILIVGSGFAGSILARILAVQGRDVVLIEKGRHPRFALGESSTPLAALSLERLAARYGLEDLRNLATYGRWSRHLPQLRRGLKRGFTFYRHSPGEPFENGPDNDRRLLVAASPEDEIADLHWLRSDVDAFLVDQAVAAGVDYRPETELTSLEEGPSGIRASGLGCRGKTSFEASFLIDASGGGGFLQSQSRPQLETDLPETNLIFSHFEGVTRVCATGLEGWTSLGIRDLIRRSGQRCIISWRRAGSTSCPLTTEP